MATLIGWNLFWLAVQCMEKVMEEKEHLWVAAAIKMEMVHQGHSRVGTPLDSHPPISLEQLVQTM